MKKRVEKRKGWGMDYSTWAIKVSIHILHVVHKDILQAFKFSTNIQNDSQKIGNPSKVNLIASPPPWNRHPTFCGR